MNSTFLLIFFLIGLVSPQIFQAYNFVIIGGGSASSILGRRLSDNPSVTVLVIEEGPEVVPPPAVGTFQPTGSPLLRNFISVEPGLAGRIINVASPKVYGGASTINAAGWTRGAKEIYDQWAVATGDPSWSFNAILPFFQVIENYTGPTDTPDIRGRNGLINVIYPNTAITNEVDNFNSTAQSVFNTTWNPDQNGLRQDGVSLGQSNVKPPNIRQGSYQTYLDPVEGRPNLKLVQRATVTKINFLFNIALSVTYVVEGVCHFAFAKTEIILSAGALLSPKILKLSGIGPPAELAANNITLISNLTGVGYNLRNHILLTMRAMGRPIAATSPNVFVFTSSLNLTVPDLQWIVSARSMIPGIISPSILTFTLGHMQNLTSIGGNITLNSNDPLDIPKIFQNFYIPDQNYAPLIKLFRLTRQFINRTLVAGSNVTEVAPGVTQVPENASDGDIRTYIQQNAQTFAHFEGSCKMGNIADPTAVVDSRLRVIGVKRLRVVDASVIPVQVNTGNHWATLMIAEKASSMILQDAGFQCANSKVSNNNVFESGLTFNLQLNASTNSPISYAKLLINFDAKPSEVYVGGLTFLRQDKTAIEYAVSIGDGISITISVTAKGVRSYTFEFSNILVQSGLLCLNS